MTAPSGIRQGVGFRNVRLYELDANGYPNATDTNPYVGVLISGAKSLTVSDPEPRQIVHTGDDNIIQLDVLPPTEPISGVLTVGKTNDDVDEIISGDAAAQEVGEIVLFPIGHSERGNEAQVAILAYRQSLEADESDANFGSRVWESRLFPKAWLLTQEGSLDENPESRTYAMRPNMSTRYPWGASCTGAGVTRAQGFRGVGNYKPIMSAWKGDNSATTFSMATGYAAVGTGNLKVFVNGTDWSSTATLATNSVVFETAPTTGAMIVAFYEHA